MGYAPLPQEGASHTPQQTLLRLLTQNLEMHFDWSLGCALQNDTLTATTEQRTTAELDKLWRIHGRSAISGPAGLPIVVLRVGSVEFVIDGKNRINKLVAANAPGSYSVIVVEAEQVKRE